MCCTFVRLTIKFAKFNAKTELLNANISLLLTVSGNTTVRKLERLHLQERLGNISSVFPRVLKDKSHESVTP